MAPLITRLCRALACCRRGSLTTSRIESRGGRPEEGLTSTHAHLQRRELPHVGDPGDQQGRGNALEDEPQEVGGQHDALARQAVRPHPADEDEHGERDEVRRLHKADVRGRPADGQHGERQRHHA